MGTGDRHIMGILLVGVGVGFLLDAMGVWDFGGMISRYWPLAIIALGLQQLVAGRCSRASALTLIGLGLGLQAWRLGFLGGIRWSYVWPVGIILAGLWYLWGRRETEDGKPTPLGSEVSESAIFSSVEASSDARPFRGGRVSALFGGVAMDLRGAVLAPEGARLQADATFGTVELRVPREWRVSIRGTPVLGSLENKGGDAPQEGPLLEVDASAVCGTVEISR